MKDFKGVWGVEVDATTKPELPELFQTVCCFCAKCQMNSNVIFSCNLLYLNKTTFCQQLYIVCMESVINTVIFYL